MLVRSHRIAPAVVALALLALAGPAAVAGADDDRASAIEYLEESRDRFLGEVSGLSEAQATYRPDEESWSLLDITEHLVVIEGRLYGILTERVAGSEPHPEWRNGDAPLISDSFVRLAATNRGRKFKAPDFAQPDSRFANVQEALAAFAAARAKTLEFAKTTDVDLRTHFAEHPVLGMLDGHQWLTFLAAHVERHLAQALEVKADAEFPSRPIALANAS